MNITYLQPFGATFTGIAYEKLARTFGAPIFEGASTCYEPADKNEDVLALMLRHGGFGALAMETKAQGRVDPPTNSFIDLLRHPYHGEFPIKVVGALRMKIHFALMARPGLSIEKVQTIMAHEKGLGACRARIEGMNATMIEMASNGQATKEASEALLESGVAALGPKEAAEKYGLHILHPAFENSEAVTTFFLLAPQSFMPKEVRSEVWRSLCVFRVRHEPGALVDTLIPFREHAINLRLIHSLHTGNGSYDFAIETECDLDRLDSMADSFAEASPHMDTHILFGPYPVIG